MGTLYDCLREARLEKYYSAFRANGITCSESLAHLTMPEFCAMGISGAEDRRRLVELVNIIKSVHREQLNSGAAVPRKRLPGSPTPSSSRPASGGAVGGSFVSQSDKKVPRRHTNSPAEEAVGGPSPSTSGRRLEPTRQVNVRERGPNFSVASYMDMLEFMSDGSQSDSDHLSQSQDNEVGSQPSRPVSAPTAASSSTSGKVSRKVAAVERVKQPVKSKGYNYGVPGHAPNSHRSVAAKPKVRASANRPTRDEKIRVCVRKRPLSRRESRASDVDIVAAGSTTTLVVKEPKVTVDLSEYTMKHKFVFDEVFDETCSNQDVYIRAARPLIGSVFDRGNATFFAYGQTGAGKTHTMIGGNGVSGLYQLAAQDVFDIINSGQHGTDLHVWVSFFEIYCGQLFDLLNKRNRLVAREDGSQRVCIAGLTETEVPDVNTLIKVLQYGNSVRSRGTSNVNPDSSRSHAVLQMEIRHVDEDKLGKISFIDLAGSERASDMGDPDRQTRMEGAEINQSLLALKECIRSIDQESRHTPFRQSKLTHILKDAFVGNSRTCMIANVSPAQSSCEHTLNTLRYADRVKELRRDSSQSSGSATFGQAMNLLMNIPITAPTIFHPSNVLSTSTPVRPNLSRQQTPAVAADITLDPSETPIRGHNVPVRTVSKPRVKMGSGQSNTAVRQQMRPVPPPAMLTVAQGARNLAPEVSPSESDHTDTDSNNVTHPTEIRPAPTQPNIPVIGSTDTEFDFPTSDFNNIDDQLNDLNQGGNDLNKAKERKGSGDKGQSKGQESRDQTGLEQVSSASANSSALESQRSKTKTGAAPFSAGNKKSSDVNSKPEFSSSPTHRQSRASPSPSSQQSKNVQNTTEKLPTSGPPSSSSSAKDRFSRQQKPAMSGLGNHPVSTSDGPHAAGPLTDSFDDELLFAAPAGSEAPTPELQQPSHSSGPSGTKTNKHPMNVLPAVQTALSSDLTSFAQRSPLRSGTDKTLANQSLRNHRAAAPPDHASASPRYAEVESGTRGTPREPTATGKSQLPSPSAAESGTRVTPREPTATGKSQLPSPSAAAVRDWVSQTDVHETRLISRDTKRHGAEPHKVNSVAGYSSHLPFTAYSSADNSPRHQLSAREHSQAAAKPVSSDRPDPETNFKTDPLRGLSGPSSDPTVPNFNLHSARNVKDAHQQSSNSLPTQSNPDSARRDTVVESHAKNSVPSTVSASQFTAMKPSTSSALVTEKLWSGAMFSPIHPQPVSSSETQVGGAGFTVRGVSASIVHPTPVAGIPSESSSSVVISDSAFSVAERDQARVSLVGSHEDQLAAITSLCKQEMKLLLSAKKAIPRSFDDYIHRVNGILSQKMAAIRLLQDQIQDYQIRFTAHHQPLGASAAYGNYPDGNALRHN